MITSKDKEVLASCFDGYEKAEKTKEGIVVYDAEVAPRFHKLNPKLPAHGKYLLTYSWKETPASRFTAVGSTSLEVSFKLLEC